MERSKQYCVLLTVLLLLFLKSALGQYATTENNFAKVLNSPTDLTMISSYRQWTDYNVMAPNDCTYSTGSENMCFCSTWDNYCGSSNSQFVTFYSYERNNLRYIAMLPDDYQQFAWSLQLQDAMSIGGTLTNFQKYDAWGATTELLHYSYVTNDGSASKIKLLFYNYVTRTTQKSVLIDVGQEVLFQVIYYGSIWDSGGSASNLLLLVKSLGSDSHVQVNLYYVNPNTGSYTSVQTTSSVASHNVISCIISLKRSARSVHSASKYTSTTGLYSLTSADAHLSSPNSFQDSDNSYWQTLISCAWHSVYFNCQTLAYTTNNLRYKITYQWTSTIHYTPSGEDNGQYQIQTATVCARLNDQNMPFSMALIVYPNSGYRYLAIQGNRDQMSLVYWLEKAGSSNINVGEYSSGSEIMQCLHQGDTTLLVIKEQPSQTYVKVVQLTNSPNSYYSVPRIDKIDFYPRDVPDNFALDINENFDIETSKIIAQLDGKIVITSYSNGQDPSGNTFVTCNKLCENCVSANTITATNMATLSTSIHQITVDTGAYSYSDWTTMANSMMTIQSWDVASISASLSYSQPSSNPLICATASSDPVGYLLWKNAPDGLTSVLVQASNNYTTAATITNFLSFDDNAPYAIENKLWSDKSFLLTDKNTYYGVYKDLTLDWTVFYYSSNINPFGTQTAKYDLWLMPECDPSKLSLNVAETLKSINYEFTYKIDTMETELLQFDLSSLFITFGEMTLSGSRNDMTLDFFESSDQLYADAVSFNYSQDTGLLNVTVSTTDSDTFSGKTFKFGVRVDINIEYYYQATDAWQLQTARFEHIETLGPFFSIYFHANTAPYFSSDLEVFTCQKNQNCTLNLPSVLDNQNDTYKFSGVGIPAGIQSITKPLLYNDDILNSTIVFKPTNKTKVGVYRIKLVLTDNNEDPMSSYNVQPVMILEEVQNDNYEPIHKRKHLQVLTVTNVTMSQDGVVNLIFDKEPDCGNSTQKDTIWIGRNLNQQLREWWTDLKNDIKIYLKFKDPKLAKIGAEFTFISLEGRELKLQISFENEYGVRPSTFELDILTNNAFKMNSDEILKFGKIPKAKKLTFGEEIIEVAKQVREASKPVAITTMLFNYLQRLAISMSLNDFWGEINQIEIASYIPAINITLTGSVFEANNLLVYVEQFDIIQSGTLDNLLFNFTAEYNDVYSINFNSLRMQGYSSIMILGPDFFVFVGYLLAYILYKINSQTKKTNLCNKALSHKIDKKCQPMFESNSLIRLCLESYTICGFSAILNFMMVIINNYSDFISVVTAAFCMLIFTVFPLYVCLILYRKYKTNTWKEEDCNELYEGMNKNLASRLFYVVFLWRRFMIVCAPFYAGTIVIQLFMVSQTALFCAIYTLHVRPWNTVKSQRRNQINDILLLFMNNMCYDFTAGYDESEMIKSGYVFSAFLYMMLFGNIAVMMSDSAQVQYRIWKRKYMRYYLRRQNKLKLKRQRENLEHKTISAIVNSVSNKPTQFKKALTSDQVYQKWLTLDHEEKDKLIHQFQNKKIVAKQEDKKSAIIKPLTLEKNQDILVSISDNSDLQSLRDKEKQMQISPNQELPSFFVKDQEKLAFLSEDQKQPDSQDNEALIGIIPQKQKVKQFFNPQASQKIRNIKKVDETSQNMTQKEVLQQNTKNDNKQGESDRSYNSEKQVPEIKSNLNNYIHPEEMEFKFQGSQIGDKSQNDQEDIKSLEEESNKSIDNIQEDWEFTREDVLKQYKDLYAERFKEQDEEQNDPTINVYEEFDNIQEKSNYVNPYSQGAFEDMQSQFDSLKKDLLAIKQQNNWRR